MAVVGAAYCFAATRGDAACCVRYLVRYPASQASYCSIKCDSHPINYCQGTNHSRYKSSYWTYAYFTARRLQKHNVCMVCYAAIRLPDICILCLNVKHVIKLFLIL